ncbi:hypothetical protein [Acidocella sp.]|uniref:hypothetical protein n=1 Tax=Acidocella sp. TaxID=50710 RepID=UPI002621E621|nr:hypothetical protein [Acidocella sp.]
MMTKVKITYSRTEVIEIPPVPSELLAAGISKLMESGGFGEFQSEVWDSAFQNVLHLVTQKMPAERREIVLKSIPDIEGFSVCAEIPWSNSAASILANCWPRRPIDQARHPSGGG